MKSLSIFLKKMSDGQSDMQITIKYVFIFLQIINRSHKIGVRLNKTLKLKFMLIYVVYDKYTIYPYLSGGNIIQMVLGLIWPLYPMAYKTWLKNRCISLFDIKYSLEFVSKNPPFLSRPSEAKIEIAIIWW